MFSSKKRARDVCTASFLQCLLVVIILCIIQFIIFEFYLLRPSTYQSQPVYNAQHKCNNDMYITQKQYKVVLNYLMRKNERLSAQIKDLIYNTKITQLEHVDRDQQPHYEPQPKPYKTMDDIKVLIPLPLIEDGLHENTFNWIAHKFNDYNMCHFLSSDYYPNINQHIDSVNIKKLNKFIKKQKHISKDIKTIQQLMDIPSFTISTYNTWNINPFINERMAEIARILSRYHVDIIALQEIRWTKDKNGNNILQHKLILNELENGHHSHKHGIGTQSGQKWNYIKGQLILEDDDDDEEYLVIATRFEIENSKRYILKKAKESKGRILLYASITIPNHLNIENTIHIDVFHTHFGLSAFDQCVHILEIIDIMNKYHKKNPDRLQMILGDFNTYLDFQYPMDILTVNYKNKHNDLLRQLLHSKCITLKRLKIKNDVGPFNDSWKEIYGETVDVMKTFTNFEDHRIEDPTVTDRILYRNGKVTQNKHWQVCDVYIAGDQALNIENEQTFPSDHRTVITKMYYN